MKSPLSTHEALYDTSYVPITITAGLAGAGIELGFTIYTQLSGYPSQAVGLTSLAVLLSLTGLILLKFFHRARLAAHLIVLGIYIATFGPGVFTGGIDSSGMVWLVFVPFIAALTAGGKASLFWTIIAMLSLAGLFILNRVLMVDYTVRPSGSTERLIDLACAISAMTIAIWINETVKKRMMGQLARATNQLERHNREITILAEMGSLFQACRTTEEVYPVVAQYACRLFTTESGSLFVLDASRNTLEEMANWGESTTMRRAFSPDACWALRTGKLHVAGGSGSKLVCPHVSHPSPFAYLCIPLSALGDTLGVITLIRTASLEIESVTPDMDAEPYSEPELQLATAFAEQVRLTLANSKLREALRQEAIRDPLTNLFNRRYLDETLERELKRAERIGLSLGIVMLDIDHFKDFNDAFGHQTGDAILRELGSYLLSHIRGEDVACRYGGEEFVVILPGIALDDLRERAEECRAGVKRMSVLYEGKSVDNIAVSLGISLFPQHGETSEMLLRAADQALYRAKAEGRDRVIVAS